MEKKYLLENIKIEGITPTEIWKEIAKRQRENDLIAKDIEIILNRGYKIKEDIND